ncbi:DUF3105 domain-containing protein [Planotetraspora sp. A-T 1434]|uniref:DUF3105 domain-containing protein n=1 Tax=Planotetraspora sp. A-T 1434 TaxID=2979219 RepID=UPI0021C07240|nr:DUF3105 domain-containing protein [Planotetraspora sp. A-T 1434]MCT9934495.1 DUF3105 domain-containing protein [Planotetraspora sp. A-T 1434]
MSSAEQATRRERLSQLQARQRGSERLRKVTLIGTSTLLVSGIAVAGGVLFLKERNKTSLDAVRTYAIKDRDHTTEAVTYPQSPPVGGDHDPTWINCGIYDQPVRAENVVHAQEHGAVWITHSPDLAKGDLQKLRNLVAGQEYVVLSPFAGQRSAVVASAWGKQLTLDGTDDPRLARFIRAHVKSPQAPEPGAPCDGGTGEPVA